MSIHNSKLITMVNFREPNTPNTVECIPEMAFCEKFNVDTLTKALDIASKLGYQLWVRDYDWEMLTSLRDVKLANNLWLSIGEQNEIPS